MVKSLLTRGLAIAMIVLMAGAASAADDDRGLLQGFIEDNLSSAGRQVRIDGFTGALSSEAHLDLLTVADGEGVWITLKDVTLDWSRLALLRGRLQVTKLSAAEILLPRLPKTEPGVEVPEAESTGFSLPDLPVAVNVEEISVDKIALGKPVLGEEVELAVAGSLTLDDGAGEAKLDITRLDRENDLISLDAGYANSDRNLAIDLEITEDDGGLASTLMGIPGAPSLALTAKGDAPLSDFTADIALDTDGERRIDGTVEIAAPGPDPDTPGEDTPLSFAADISGDIAPVFAPEYRAFFGPEIALVVRGSKPANGGLGIEKLSLTAAALKLDGSLQLGTEGWPERIDLTGRLAAKDGKPVLLPLSGEETTLESMDLALGYDAATGDEWTLSLEAAGLSREDLEIEAASLSGGGTLAKGERNAPGRVDGALDLDASGISLPDEKLATALGKALDGEITFDWTQGDPFRLSELSVSGSDYSVTGEAEVAGIGKPMDPRVSASIALKAADLSRFAGVAGTDLSGAADVTIDAAATPASGDMEATVKGFADDLTVGQPRLDPLLRGRTKLDVAARRGATGTFLDRLVVTSDATDLTASGAYKTDGSSAKLDLTVQDASLIEPSLKGPATIKATADQSGDTWTISTKGRGPGKASLTADGTVRVTDGKPGLFDVSASAVASDFAPYSTLAGRDLGGAASVVLDAQGNISTLSGQAEVVVNGQDLAIGIPQADALLRGETSAEIDAQRSSDGAITLSRGEFETPKLSATAQGYMGADGTAQLEADLTGTDIETGITQVDPILRGRTEVSVMASRDAQGAISVSRAKVDNPQISASAQGYMGADGAGQLEADVAATDIVTGIAQVDPILRGRTEASVVASRDAEGTIEVSRANISNPQVTASGQGFYKANGAAGGQVDLRGTNLAIGVPQVDQLLRGTSTLKADLTRAADGAITIKEADLKTPQVTADASGTIGTDGDASATFDARLANVALFAPGIPGAATAKGTVRGDGSGYIVDIDATGPAGITASAEGRVGNDGTLAMDVNGRAPLALANAFISPRSLSGIARFDLRVSGPPQPSSVTGTISTSGAGLSLPQAKLALEGISADIRLTGGAAQLNIGAGVNTGGRLAINGRVGLSAPYQADIAVDLQQIGITDPGLYTTKADGRITFNGPATGGANIAGRIDLGEVNVRVPNGAISSGASLPGLEHVNEPSSVRRTRGFANLLDSGGDGAGTGGGGPSYGLDVTVNAPARIFIRGRGLDAELGGSLRLQGTTQSVIPSGQFDLLRGRLDILSERLDLTDGYLRMQGSFVPYLYLRAETTSGDVRVIIVIEGPATEPEIVFSSNPELPEDQVLSQLIFGRDITEISAFQAIQLAQAVRTLAGKGGDGVVGKLRKGVGLDNLDVTSGEGDTTEVRAGKYLSENVYSEVEVDSDGETQINLNLEISDTVKAKGSFGAGGDSGLGIFFEKDY